MRKSGLTQADAAGADEVKTCTPNVEGETALGYLLIPPSEAAVYDA